MWTIDVINSIFSFWFKPIIIFSVLGLCLRVRTDKSPSMCHWMLFTFGVSGMLVLIGGWFSPVTLNLALIPHGVTHWLAVTLGLFSAVEANSFWRNYIVYIFGTYLCVTFFLINLRFYDLYITWRVVNTATKLTDTTLVATIHRVKMDLNIKKQVSVYVSDDITAPMVWGVFRPRIILPESYILWDEGRAMRVIAHELAHIKRNDWIVKQIAYVLSCVLWGVPGVRLWQQRIDWYAELACDDMVIYLYDCRAEYATDLMDLGTSMRLNQAFLGLIEAQTLAARITCVLEPGREREQLNVILKAGASFVFFVMILFLSILRFSPMSWLYSDEYIVNYSAQKTPAEPSENTDRRDVSSDDHNVLIVDELSVAHKQLIIASSLPRVAREENLTVFSSGIESTPPESHINIDKESISVKSPVVSMSGYVGRDLVVPIYPRRALQKNVEGKVTALFDIDERGRVQNIRLIDTYPKHIFDSAVIAALKKSKYESTKIYNYAVTTKNVKETFLFKIRYTTNITND